MLIGYDNLLRIRHSRKNDTVQKLPVSLLVAPNTGRRFQDDGQTRFFLNFPPEPDFKILMKEQSSSGKFPGMPAFYIIFLQEQQLAVVKDHRLDTESHQDIPFLRHTINSLSLLRLQFENFDYL